MTEPEAVALLEVTGPEAPDESPAPAPVPDGPQPEGAGEADAPAGRCPPAPAEHASQAATLPWGSAPRPSAPDPPPDPPGWRDLDIEPLEPDGPPAARASVPIDLRCVERPAPAAEAERRRPPAPPRPARPEPAGPARKWAEAEAGDGAGGRGCGGRGGREGLRAVGSLAAALLLLPALLYGAFALLPFDAPRLPTLSARLVYTLRCGVFATFPIVLGLLVHGLSLLCFSALRPFAEPRREVEIHRRYVSQSVQLFILYFFNLAVLATYLPQGALKLLPLLTGLFAVSRLIYWLTFAVGRSFRGFGFGLTFLPLLAMLLWNLYYMFVVEPERMLTAESRLDYPDHARSASDYRPRPWG